MASAHREQVMYEYDPAAEHYRRRVPTGRCAACRAAWPCLAERMQQVARQALARPGVQA